MNPGFQKNQSMLEAKSRNYPNYFSSQQRYPTTASTYTQGNCCKNYPSYYPHQQTQSFHNLPNHGLKYHNFNQQEGVQNRDHQLVLNCLRKCTQWSVTIKINNSKFPKIPSSAKALKQLGTYENGGSQPFQADIIDNLIEKENQLSWTQIPYSYTSKNEKLHLKQFNSFEPKGKQLSFQLPLDNSDQDINSKVSEILKEKKGESLICLEFDVSKLQMRDDSNLFSQQPQDFKLVNQQLVESNFHFFINGYCHNQRVLTQDIHFQLQGKKIIKSIQQRIIDYKQYLTNLITQTLMKNNIKPFNKICLQYPTNPPNLKTLVSILNKLNIQSIGPFLNRPSSLHVKMLNLSKSIGMEVDYNNLTDIENFLTNFNQIVLQEGIIKKFLFCFDLPLSQFQKANINIQRNILSPIVNSMSNEKSPIVKNEGKEGIGAQLLREFNKGREQKPQQETNEEQKGLKTSVLDQHQQIQMVQPQLNLRQEIPLMVKKVETDLRKNYGYQYPQFMQHQVISYQNYQQNSMKLQQYQHQHLLPKFYHSNIKTFNDLVSPQFNQYLTLKELFDQFEEVSMTGLKVLVEFKGQRELQVYHPTLSSINLQYDPNMLVNSANTQLIKRKDSNTSSQNQTDTTQSTLDFDNTQILIPDSSLKYLRYVEKDPPYLRQTFNDSINSLLSNKPFLSELHLKHQIFEAEDAYFAINWYCIKQKSLSDSINETFPQNPQFLVFYRFRGCKNEKDKLEILGFIPFKEDNTNFWVYPLMKEMQYNAMFQHQLEHNLREFNKCKYQVDKFVNSAIVVSNDYNFYSHYSNQ